MSPLFELCKVGYNTPQPQGFTKDNLQQCVYFGWITQAEMNQIIGVNSTQPA